ncbi:TonB-linked outer membrane protein, SusC/RagA family [bacterium A37T11]|nr:TonB-linked outer membrane protein, SusC/RagA family [bacterium A37T11]
MKLRIKTCLLIVCSFSFQGLRAEQLYNNEGKISIKLKNTDASAVIKEIGRQIVYSFIYSPEQLAQVKVPKITFNSIPLREALQRLKNLYGMDYHIHGSTISIRLSSAHESVERAKQKTGKISGLISDKKGNPLAGANVRLVEMNKTFPTDADGKYHFFVFPGTYTLEVTYLSYAKQQKNGIHVGLDDNTEVNFRMLEESGALNEVVVVGYGTMKKSDLSAAVATVPDIQQGTNRPVVDLPSMIQGKVPGVTVVSGGGHPNSTPKITIRGVGSIADENPLVVVDGVPGAPYNPADVQAVTILKDAASAAIYGAFSGASGVILVTTKQAQAGAPSIQYNAFAGAKSAWRLPQSLTGKQEAEVYNHAYQTAGLIPPDGWDASKNPDAQVTRTDWVNEIFQTALTNRHSLTVNAGTDKFATLLQGRYEKNEGTLLNTFNENISLRFNAHYDLTDHLKLKQEVFYNNNNSRGTETDNGYSGAIISAIYMPRSASVYYPDGSFGGVGPRDSEYLGIFGDAINPVATLLRNDSYNKTNDIQSVSEISYANIIPGLNVFSRFSYHQSNYFYKYFDLRRTEPGKPNDQNILSYNTNKNYNWLWENTINYDHTFNKHRIGAMFSTTSTSSSSRGFGTAARNFEREDNWAQFFINANDFDSDRPNDGQSDDRNVSYVGRLSYSWADRYFVTGSYRKDIAGRIPKDYQGKGFPGLTAAWKLSSEPFFKVEGIDLLKFRASWGRIGNLSTIGVNYGYPTLVSNTAYQIGNGAPISTGWYINDQFNPALSWETSEQQDLGMDLSLLKERLSVTADYFNKKTFDLIQRQSTGWPNTFGLGSPLINQGEIHNEGFEVSLNWKDHVGSLEYNIGGNLATLKNRVASISEDPNAFITHPDSWRGILTPFRSKVGEPYYSYWLVKTDGIFQSDQETQSYIGPAGTPIQPNAKAGDLKFVDYNNDGQIDDQDRIYMGNAFPKLTYGFSAGLNWKNFDLNLFFQGVGGVKLFNAFKQSTLNAGEQGYNRWDKILDAWSSTNPDTKIPRANVQDPNNNFSTNSDWYLESGSYLRLKNVMLGYTFPKLPKKMKLHLYLTGENLFTVTNYSGMDPEVGGTGMDGGQYPVARSYAIGINLTY